MSINLKLGYRFYYNNKHWKIIEVYNITWEDGTKSKEYKIKSDSGLISFLEITTDKETRFTFSFWTKRNKPNFLETSQKLTEDFIFLGKAKFPKKTTFYGAVYYFDEQVDGICNYGYEKEKVNSLNYSSKDKKKLLSIELWDDEIEVSTGIIIKRSDISKIETGHLSILNTSFLNLINKYVNEIIIILLLLFFFLLEKCSNKNSWENNSNYNSSDSTKIYRNNNYYRGRSFGGFGK